MWHLLKAGLAETHQRQTILGQLLCAPDVNQRNLFFGNLRLILVIILLCSSEFMEEGKNLTCTGSKVQKLSVLLTANLHKISA